MSLLAFSFIGFLKGLLMFFFVLGSFLLMLIVLLQEPKGGGLSSAFGGAGQDTFGVQTGGVSKFTAWTAGIWIGLAVLYAAIRQGPGFSVMDFTPPPATGIESTDDGNTTDGSGTNSPNKGNKGDKPKGSSDSGGSDGDGSGDKKSDG